MIADDNHLMIPCHISDISISHSQEETQEPVQAAKKNLQETDVLESRVESIQWWMLGDFKVHLCTTGSSINPEVHKNDFNTFVS
uniref:Uncharacterized protein n=1 Tax=Sus scrofa TaxID=9823 RepID=A0A8D1E324_PIG